MVENTDLNNDNDDQQNYGPHIVYSGYSIQFYFFLTEELENTQEESQLMFFPDRPKYFEVSSVDSLDYLVIVDFYPERYARLVGKAYDMEAVVQEISDYLNAGIASILENRVVNA